MARIAGSHRSAFSTLPPGLIVLSSLPFSCSRPPPPVASSTLHTRCTSFFPPRFMDPSLPVSSPANHGTQSRTGTQETNAHTSRQLAGHIPHDNLTIQHTPSSIRRTMRPKIFTRGLLESSPPLVSSTLPSHQCLLGGHPASSGCTFGFVAGRSSMNTRLAPQRVVPIFFPNFSQMVVHVRGKEVPAPDKHLACFVPFESVVAGRFRKRRNSCTGAAPRI